MGVGRKPVPTALKLIRGNPGRRPLPEHEPQVECEIPDCPEHLTESAKKHWYTVAELLLSSKVITKLDADALSLLCDAYARWVEATTKVQEHGLVVKSPSGFAVQSPFLGIANKAHDQLRSLLSEFGMTPSSRTKIQTTDAKKNEVNPWDGLA